MVEKLLNNHYSNIFLCSCLIPCMLVIVSTIKKQCWTPKHKHYRCMQMFTVVCIDFLQNQLKAISIFRCFWPHVGIEFHIVQRIWLHLCKVLTDKKWLLCTTFVNRDTFVANIYNNHSWMMRVNKHWSQNIMKGESIYWSKTLDAHCLLLNYIVIELIST